MNQVHTPSISCHWWGDHGQGGAVGTGFLGAPGDRGQGPGWGGPGVTGRGAGQNLRSGVCGGSFQWLALFSRQCLRRRATEEQPEVKEASSPPSCRGE